MRIGRQVVRRFAETMLFWRGRLQAGEVQEFAGVSERTARNLFSEWRTRGLLPPYRPSTERYLIPAEDFDPSPHVTDPVIAFTLLLTRGLSARESICIVRTLGRRTMISP